LYCCSFKTSKNDHVIEVKLYDDIDFVCPFYPPSSVSSASLATASASRADRRRHHERLEFYVVYMVSRAKIHL